MIKSNKHIEIVRSPNPGLSSLSQESCDAIQAVLKKHYRTVNVTLVNDVSDLNSLVLKQPDLVFMGMKYLPDVSGQKIWISAFLEANNIPHTGSSHSAIEFELDKNLAKQQVLDAGLNTAAFVVIKHDEIWSGDNFSLKFPLFVKPTNMGGGQGIDGRSVIHNLADLQLQAEFISASYTKDSLVEEYLPGREFSVAILKKEHTEELMALPIELVTADNAEGNRFLSQEVKASNQETVLPVIEGIVRSSVVELATQVFGALGGRDYGRIDIRLDEAGIPHFLEANLIPSLISGYGSFPKACILNIGLGHEDMILHIVRLGMARQPVNSKSELAWV